MPKAEVHPVDLAIARRVEEARAVAGLSKADLAERLGLSKQGYTPYERGAHAYTVVELLELSRILRRTVEWLAGLAESRVPEEDAVLAAMRRISDPQLRSFAVAQCQSIAGFKLPARSSEGQRAGNGGNA